jgi:hypothetical protein
MWQRPPRTGGRARFRRPVSGVSRGRPATRARPSANHHIKGSDPPATVRRLGKIYPAKAAIGGRFFPLFRRMKNLNSLFLFGF